MLTNNPVVPLILVVEDNEYHTELIQRSFENGPEEYRLKFATTLLDAHKEIDLQLPNLIVTDYRLPDGDGSGLMLRTNGACPVVIMTSQGNEQVAVEAMKCGAHDYIVKSPEAFGRLPDTVKYALKTWALTQTHKLADEAVRRGKREWEQTFDAVPDLIALIDANHKILRVNRAMAERCKLDPQDLIGRSCHELVHCSNKPTSFCPHVRMLLDGRIHTEEVEIKELGGFFEITVSPLYGDDGLLIASVHVARDISERKKIEIELKNSMLQMKTIFEASNAGIISFTSDWKSGFFNRRILEIFGYSTDELVSMSYLQLLHPDYHAEATANIHELERGQIESVTSERLFIRKDGSTFWGFLSGRSMIGDGGKWMGYIALISDISKRKLAEEKREEMERQFQQTQKLESLGVLAGGIAHDFNNILTIILGHSYIITNEIHSGMTYKEHALQIEAAGNRAAELCSQMLTYAGQSSQLQTRVNLWQQVDEVIKMLNSAIKKNVTIKLDLKRNIPELSGDNAQIQQIIMNLIINASEAIGDKNGTIKVALNKISIQEGQLETDFMGNAIPVRDYACLEVTDSGCGIDPETQKRIFEPFFTTKFTGRGLGMSVVLGLVKSHDGALQLISSAGVGTTFKVYFPLLEKTIAIETEQTVEFTPFAKTTGTILLVDDEESLRTIGCALLKAMGYSTITASNGSEALEIYGLRENEIDLILMDMIMPVMSGMDAYHILREVSPSVPIVICSGYNLENVLVDLENDENAAVIQKPYKPDLLRSVLLKLLDKTG